MVPLAGDLGIGVGITSFDKHLYLSVMADPTILDDIEQVGEYIDDEFALLRYVAQVPSSDLPDVGAPRNGNGHGAQPRAASTPVAKKVGETCPARRARTGAVGRRGAFAARQQLALLGTRGAVYAVCRPR